MPDATALSKYTFTKMKSIFTNRNIKVYTKINTLKAYIWSIPLYGCECWTLKKELERRLEVAKIWYIRRIMRIMKKLWKWLDTKDPYSKPSEKDNYNFWAYEQS